jgi:group I intron endonuclease
MKNIGVYRIFNNLDGKQYIGSSNDISRRISDHKSSLMKKQHSNIHLQRAWNCDGEEAFTFEVIKYFKSHEQALRHENKLLKDYQKKNEWEQLYNIAKDVYSPNKRKPLSEEHRANISKSKVGKKLSTEHLEKLREARKKFDNSKKSNSKPYIHQHVLIHKFLKNNTKTQRISYRQMELWKLLYELREKSLEEEAFLPLRNERKISRHEIANEIYDYACERDYIRVLQWKPQFIQDCNEYRKAIEKQCKKAKEQTVNRIQRDKHR